MTGAGVTQGWYNGINQEIEAHTKSSGNKGKNNHKTITTLQKERETIALVPYFLRDVLNRFVPILWTHGTGHRSSNRYTTERPSQKKKHKKVETISPVMLVFKKFNCYCFYFKGFILYSFVVCLLQTQSCWHDYVDIVAFSTITLLNESKQKTPRMCASFKVVSRLVLVGFICSTRYSRILLRIGNSSCLYHILVFWSTTRTSTVHPITSSLFPSEKN